MRRVLFGALALVLLVGWDTSEEEANPWTASYLVNVPTNEHSSISDTCLQEMGADRIAIIAGAQELLQVVDLNASFFRRGLRSAEGRGDDASTTLEERDLPSPALLSGMPDYSWTIYDWINKNSLCPAVPEDARTVPDIGDICHKFKGWLGSLNSIHFGTQAELTYAHMHQLAVNLAARAQGLRSALAADPNAAVEFADFVREAEYEALAYEGYAQHFLQDRWSSGHMWERWNAGDYALLPDTDPLRNLLIGSMAGIVHGAQSVLLNIPDPLCSPEVDGSTVTPIVWSSDELGLQPGVGDYRWPEIIGTGEGMFAGGNYQVLAQYRQLIDCGQRGWAEVIRGLGSNGDESFGELGVSLDESAPAASALAPECKDAWATNEAMNIGWGIADFGTVARIALGGASVGLSRANAVELGRIQYNLWMADWLRPAGTDIARGGLGSFGGAATGNNFAAVPAYMEPQDLDTLPDEPTETGRDKRSIFGFFNRAHADHWCDPQTFARVVGPTRGSPEPADRLVCAYLAERLYRGVDPVYTRRTEARRGTSALPVCHLLGVAEAGDIEDDLPYYVHPGYLDVPGITAKRGPATGDPEYLKTIIRWCDKTPVMDVDPEDFVGTAKEDGEVARLTIEGLHFGGAAGSVEVTLDAVGAVIGDIESWANDEVTVTFPLDSLPDPLDGEEGTIVLTRDDGVATVGERFVRFESGGGGCSLDPNSSEPGLTANVILSPLQGPVPTTVTVLVPVTRGTGQVSVDLNRLDGGGQPTITLGAAFTETVNPPETVELTFQTIFAGTATYRLRVQTFRTDLEVNRVYQTNDDGTVTTTFGVGGPDPKLEPNCMPIFFESLP
jgi:hypothetical protein